ncbi:uncharacterized protein V1518DRAFT_281178 [Limtongia smithiae]|uniref:uncharacterized protein n=1 Tax=Limtongia smithiae TaxID=1125753 RepID=UPI0034CE1FED
MRISAVVTLLVYVLVCATTVLAGIGTLEIAGFEISAAVQGVLQSSARAFEYVKHFPRGLERREETTTTSAGATTSVESSTSKSGESSATETGSSSTPSSRTESSSTEKTSIETTSTTSKEETTITTSSASEGTTTAASEASTSAIASLTVAETSSATVTSIPANSPAGGVSMITPATTDSTTYIKIGDYATFSWNYTSLLVTPSAVNVEAYCSMNSYYYPIAHNLSIENTEVVWNTSGWEATATVKLVSAKYTLYIYDSSEDTTEVASAGKLAVYDDTIFGMYTPQAYTGLGKSECATCSRALSMLERNVLRGTMIMMSITVVSAAWFIML